MKKYIVIGNYVRSIKDFDLHYINSRKLCDLYKINQEECYLLEGNDRNVLRKLLVLPKLPILVPRSKGDYKLTNAVLNY